MHEKEENRERGWRARAARWNYPHRCELPL